MYFKPKFSIVFIIFTQNIFCEYLIFKKDKDQNILQITQIEHAVVYRILQNYQWPMCIAGQDKSTNITKYSLAEAGPLEENFIRAKIQEKFKDLDIVFIPNIIYELFVISKKDQLGDLEKSIKDNFSKYGALGNQKFTEILNAKNSTLEGVYEKFRNINNLKEVKYAHFLVNNLLLQFLLEKFNSTYFGVVKRYNFNSQNFAQNIKDNIINIIGKYLKKLAGSNFQYLQDIIKKWGIESHTNMYIKNLDSTMFIEIANHEYEAHSENSGLLYRVTVRYDLETEGGRYVPGQGLVNPLEYTQLFPERSAKTYLLTAEEVKELEELIKLKSSKTINKQQESKLAQFKSKLSFLFNIPSRSLSYGNSMFSGMVTDRTASPIYYFLAQYWNYFYLLKINKFSYLKHTAPLGESELLFRITPLSNLAAIFAKGEYFHPRTKSYYFKNFGRSIKGIDLSSINQELTRDNINYLVMPGNPIEMNAKLSYYIAQNAIVLRPTQKSEADKLIEDQKSITALFKAMDVIYKYIKRDEELLK